MNENISGKEIQNLINALAKLPGLGPRSARRAALFMVKKKESLMMPLAKAINEAVENITTCQCGNIATTPVCSICASKNRDHKTIIVVEDVADLWALERATNINAIYHVLGGVLSPLDGIGPDELNLKSLMDKIKDNEIKEIIIALNATIDGQTTAHYITGEIQNITGEIQNNNSKNNNSKNNNVKVSRLAHGVPVGGELDYLDDGTITAALKARTPLQ